MIVRSPADMLRLAVAVMTLLLVLITEALFGNAIAGFASDLFRGLDALGEGVTAVIVVALRLSGIAFVLLGLGTAIARGGIRVAATVAFAAALGTIVFAVAELIVDENESALTTAAESAGIATNGEPATAIVVAIAAAVVTSAGPWISRRYRRLGWFTVLGLAAAHFLVAPVSATTAAALASGWVGGAAAVAALGAPSLRPAAAAVLTGLRSVGLDLATLDAASVDARGSTPYFGTSSTGDRYFVKVLGRDQRDADLLFRLYRYLVPRDLGDERPFSSLRRAVEHEALVALAAARIGVRTPEVAALADADPHGFVLAYNSVAGRSLDRVGGDELTDDVLVAVWGLIGVLRAHRIAHRDLRLANVFLGDDGAVWLIDFGFAELAASPQLLATDIAELVTALALTVGAPRAIASGRIVLGDQAMKSCLPRLQSGYLSGATRSAVKGTGLLDEIRAGLGHKDDDIIDLRAAAEHG